MALFKATFKCQWMSTFVDTSAFRSPLLQMEEEKKEHVQKMKKMEAEMEQVFEMKVKEKRQKLKDSETDVSFSRNVVIWFTLKKLNKTVGWLTSDYMLISIVFDSDMLFTSYSF